MGSSDTKKKPCKHKESPRCTGKIFFLNWGASLPTIEAMPVALLKWGKQTKVIKGRWETREEERLPGGEKLKPGCGDKTVDKEKDAVVIFGGSSYMRNLFLQRGAFDP